VLNVGSGPGRDILEYLNSFPQSRCRFLCVDHDPNAIRYAQTLCRDHYPSQVEFIQKNAFRFKSDQKFHIIWSAGLFDYLDNRLFIALLKRLAAFLKPGGQIIIGNFSQNNPTRAYMEMVGNWFLHHRTSEELFELARAAGFDNPALSIHTEPTRINLFLHIG
jgi:extracellular factor (EF) 3-hydroxypalmitic acid methyl ester biosynthesis protein